MLKEVFFFNLHMDEMAAFDWIKLLRLKNTCIAFWQGLV